jgi:hypothetical protein
MIARRLARLAVLTLIGLICMSMNGHALSEGVVAPAPERRATVGQAPIQLALKTAVTPTAIPQSQVITVEAEELNLNYSQGFYWDEEQFAQEYDEYSVDKAEYLKDFVESFSTDFLQPANLQATNWKVSFRSEYELEADKATYLTLIQCQIHGAASGTAERPTFRFEWLLKPIFGNRPDLYDFEQPTDRTLVYEGEIDHIPTTITLEFPEPLSHCHYHVWYKR